MIRNFMSAEATVINIEIIAYYWGYYKNAMFQDFQHFWQHLACRPNFSTKRVFPCLCKQIPNPSKLQLILQTSQEEAENIKSILLKLCKHSKQRCMFLLSLFPATFIQVSTKTNKYLFSSIHIYCPYLPFLLMFLKAQTCILSKSSKGWLLRVKLVEALHLMPPKSSKLANFLNILKA